MASVPFSRGPILNSLPPCRLRTYRRPSCFWHSSLDSVPAGLWLFWLHPCRLGQYLCTPLRLPVPASMFCMPIFCIWVPLLTHASLLPFFAWLKSSLGFAALEFGRADPWTLTSYLGPLLPPKLYPMGLCCPEVQRCDLGLLPCFFLSESWSPPCEGRQAWLTLKVTTPMSPSLFHEVQQRYPLSLGSGSCQSALSSNLLGCSCPAVLSLQATSGWLRSSY